MGARKQFAHWKDVCRIYATAVVGLLAAGATLTEAAATGERSLAQFSSRLSSSKNSAPLHPVSYTHLTLPTKRIV